MLSQKPLLFTLIIRKDVFFFPLFGTSGFGRIIFHIRRMFVCVRAAVYMFVDVRVCLCVFELCLKYGVYSQV